MAKRNRTITAEKNSKFITEGRGDGSGASYKPWLTIQDVPSIGLVHRIRGYKHGRIHHLMSNLERDYFYLLDWSSTVTDIREQYPLLPQEETLKIAEQCNIKHPRDPKTNHPIVMTTDFVVDVCKGGITQKIARTLKYSNQLESKRVLEKFEIERRYWISHNVDWKIITESNLPFVFIRNIDLLRSYRNINDRGIENHHINRIKNELKILIHQDESLSEICTECDETLGLPFGSSLCVAYHLIATQAWNVNLQQPFDSCKPIEFIDMEYYYESL